MFRLFENRPSFSRTTLVPPLLPYVRSELQKITSRFIAYYSGVEKYVNNNNQFVRLLTLLRIHTSIPEDDINGIVRDRMGSLGSLTDITTYMKKGNAITPGAFYGKNACEVWIGHDQAFTKGTRAKDIGSKPWGAYNPIKIIRHDHDVVSYPYLDGTYIGPEDETVVITINLPMLAYMIWLWDNYHLRTTGSLLPVEVFMTNVIIPSLIESHLDIVFVNQLCNGLIDIPNTNNKWYTNPFFIQDISNKFNPVVQQIVKTIKATMLTYEEVLDVIPSLRSNKALIDCLRMPDSLITHNNRWALLVAYLPLLKALVTLDNLQNNERNIGHRGRMWQFLRFMRNDGTIVSAFNRANAVTSAFISAEMDALKLEIENK